MAKENKKSIEGIWEAEVIDLEIRIGENKTKKIPVFHLTYKIGMSYFGDIYANPNFGIFTFQVKKGNEPLYPLPLNERSIKLKLKQYGWKEPPSKAIRAAIKGVKELGSYLNRQDMDGFFKACEKVRKEWQEYCG